MPVNQIEAAFFYDPPRPDPYSTPLLNSEEISAAFDSCGMQALGRGSFGETWLIPADSRYPNQRVAKIIFDRTYPPEYLKREVEGLEKVRHSNVVNFLESIEIELRTGRTTAFIFDFIDGGDVASRMSVGEPATSDSEILGFANGLLSAIQAMHIVEMIHRDIKPANIMLREENWADPVLLDLGLAKLLDNDTLTVYPTLMGTLPFMSPEQIRMEEARKASDIWSIGVVLYLLATGRHPFYGDRSQALSRIEALECVIGGPKPLPLNTSPILSDLILRFLSPEPHHRGSAARALRDLGNGQ